MHFEILVEDASGRIVLDKVTKKILMPCQLESTYRTIAYKGLGHIPRNLIGTPDPRKRLLLSRLPALLRGYGKSLRFVPSTVVIVVDLDTRDCVKFKEEMVHILELCYPKPNALFRIAIEEMEAWLLGDHAAVKAAYPRAKDTVLQSYIQDSICGTWEQLADAIYPGGSQRLSRIGYPEIGRVKCEWADRIGEHLNPDVNRSKSFAVFRDAIKRLAEAET